MGSRLDQKSNQVRKRIQNHTFDDEAGDEYGASAFGGFPEYFRRKKIKLQNLDHEIRAQAGDKPQIFGGVVAHVNGYTQPSLNDLHVMIVEHGGGFIQYLDGKTMVTHIIASSLTPKKAIEFRRYRIVKPSWVVDSIKAGRLLPWDEYRVLDQGVKQKTLGFNNGQIFSQTSTHARGYRDQSDGSWYTKQLEAQQVASSSSQKPASTLSKARREEDEPEEIDDSPPSSPPPKASSQKRKAEVIVTGPNDDPSTPKKTKMAVTFQETPQIIRDIRQMEAAGELDDTEEDTPPDTPSKSSRYQYSSTQPTKLANSVSMSSDVAPIEEYIPPELEDDFLDEADLSFYQPQDMQAATDAGKDASDANTEGAPDSKDGDDDLYADPAMNIDMRDEADTRKVPKNYEEHYHMTMEGRTGPEADADAERARMTAEEHNAVLLADPRVRKSTVINPAFLEQYYRESRLHHLSAWKADLKAQMQALAEEKSLSQKARQKRPVGARRYIMHVDFDSFFAAVSLLKAPQWKDKPTVVAHGGGTGSEIASCNYPARKYGIKNGMWMKRAQELCADIKVLPYDFPAYEEASKAFYEAIIATEGIVQSVSIDEALIDVSVLCARNIGNDGIKQSEGSVYREEQEADNIATQLRAEIKKRTACDVSIGIGGNILLAKVALRKAKPAGQYHLRPEEVLSFIGELEVESLPGVAHNLGSKLESMGIKYVKDIREFTKERLMTTLGPKTGEKLWEYARGIDRKEVGDVEVRKSVSAEVNWGVRFVTQEQVDEFIINLCGELHKRLMRSRVKGRQLSLKIMRRAADAPLDPPKHLGHGKCDTFNKSVTLGVATLDHDVISKETLSILRSFGFTPGEFRGIGVQMTQLQPLKGGSVAQAEGSQRRLGFRSMGFAPMPKSASKPARAKSPIRQADDPIEDSTTPQKDENRIGFGADQLGQITPTKKPLNVAGTQFMLPSQVDPKVLAELPEDIRSKLAKHITPRAAIPPPDFKQSDSEQNAGPSVKRGLVPSESQIDPEILRTLPTDIRNELISFYRTSIPETKPRPGSQTLLPQSPRKNRIAAPPGFKPMQPIARRGRGRPGRFDPRSNGSNSTLTQSNFIAARLARERSHTPTTDTDTEHKPGDKQGDEIDPEFLAALPEELRNEVIAENRRQRLQQKSALSIPAVRKARVRLGQGAQGGGSDATGSRAAPIKRLLRLPARKAKPTFTSNKLSELSDLRGALSSWITEFQTEGPFLDDVQVLGTYLGRVATEEKDMAKATSVVKWLAWLLDDLGIVKSASSKTPVRGNPRDPDAFGSSNPDESKKMTQSDSPIKWKDALGLVQAAVQDAVHARGLGRVKF